MAYIGKKLKVTLNTARDTILSTIISTAYMGFPACTIYIEGPSGIGKSAIVSKITSMLNEICQHNQEGDKVTWELLDKRLAGFNASDLQGIPYPAQTASGNRFFKWLKDSGLPGIGDHSDWGILFLDELNQVDDEGVQSLTYQLLLDRKINDYTIPDGWFIVCAGNREEDGGVYERIKAPVRNRMMILEILFDKDEWFQWASETNIHPSVVSFLKFKESTGEEVFQTYDADKESSGDTECENYIFTTPRTWEFVSSRLYGLEKMSEMPDGNVKEILVNNRVYEATLCGLLGENLGKEFYTHYKHTSRVPLEAIFNAEWKNNKPVKSLGKNSLTKGEDVFIMSSVKNVNNHKITSKVIIYLMYVNANPNTIKVLLSDLSHSEVDEYIVDYLTRTNCSKILGTYNDIARGSVTYKL